jgi:hypothetical protein
MPVYVIHHLSTTPQQLPPHAMGNNTSTPNTSSLTSQLGYMKLKDYMNDQEITVLEEKELQKPEATTRSILSSTMLPLTKNNSDQANGNNPIYVNDPKTSKGPQTRFVHNKVSDFPVPGIQNFAANSRNSGKSDGNFGMKMKPLEVARYINTQFKMPPSQTTSPNSPGIPQPNISGINQQQPMATTKISPTLHSPQQHHGNGFDRDTKHPHQLWSRDGYGGLTYTGMFSSDC